MVVTGNSQQSIEWIAENADGWIVYPRPLQQQNQMAARWREMVTEFSGDQFKPFGQSFYIDLASNPNEPSTAIHLGFRAGRNIFLKFLYALRSAGVHHIILNLKYGSRSASDVLEEIGQRVLPELEESQAQTGETVESDQREAAGVGGNA